MSRLAILASVAAVALIGVACAETGSPSNSASSMLTGPSEFAASASSGASVSAPAAKGGNAKGGGGNTNDNYTLTLRMVTETTENDLPNWGERVTFDVWTTATTQPNVSLTCSQNGVVVYGAEAGYYESYPLQTMQLTSLAWQGGAASCVAKLYYFSGTRIINLGSISFTVAA